MFDRQEETTVNETIAAQPLLQNNDNGVAFKEVLSSYTFGLKWLYVKRNVFSIFVGNGFFAERSMSAMRAEDCIDNVIYGHRDDKRHDTWHEGSHDFEVGHMHISKPKKAMITPKEFKCILNNIARSQKGMEWAIKRNYTYSNVDECPDLRNPILLTQKDYDKLNKKYANYYYSVNPAEKPIRKTPEEPKCNAEDVPLAEADSAGYKFFNEQQKQMVKAAIDAFAQVLISHLIKPYLIDKGYDYKKINWACSFLNTAFKVAISKSLIASGLAVIAQTILKPALLTIGIDTTSAENLASKIASVIAVTTNPLLTLGNIFGNYCGAELGQNLGLALVRSFGKFKVEPQYLEVKDEGVVNPLPNLNSEGLRRRL